MIVNLATRSALSMKKEIAVVLVVLAVLLFMPVAAVMAMTNIDGLNDGDGATLYTGKALTTNTYIYGYCTFWAAQRRIEIGKPIPNNWGDAHTWDDGARDAGYTVDHTPAKYAIMETDKGEFGHVAFVEEVGLDGSWKVSEMNVKGWDIKSERTFKPEQAKDYNFIH
jgi:surface antigen